MISRASGPEAILIPVDQVPVVSGHCSVWRMDVLLGTAVQAAPALVGVQD